MCGSAIRPPRKRGRPHGRARIQLEYPGYSAIVTKELGGNGNIPPNVAIPTSRQKTGYLGVQYAPLNTGATPKPGEMFSVRGLKQIGRAHV